MTDEQDRYKRVIEVIREALHTPELHTDGARLSAISILVHSQDPLTDQEIKQAHEIAKKLESEGKLERVFGKSKERS